MLFLSIASCITVLSVKLILLKVFKNRLLQKRRDTLLQFFYMCLLCMSIIELAALTQVSAPDEDLMLVLGTIYYSLLIWAFHCLVPMAIRVSNNENRWADYSILISAVFLTVIVAIPGVVIAGVQSIGYSITAIKGPLYSVFLTGIMINLLLALSVLLRHAFFSEKYNYKRSAIILLIALCPLIFSVVTIFTLMLLDFAVNLSILLSISLTWMLVIFMVTQTPESQYRFMCYVPFSSESRNAFRYISLTSNPVQQSLEAAQALTDQIILEALKLHHGNKTKAADRLGLPRSTYIGRLKAAESRLK